MKPLADKRLQTQGSWYLLFAFSTAMLITTMWHPILREGMVNWFVLVMLIALALGSYKIWAYLGQKTEFGG